MKRRSLLAGAAALAATPLACPHAQRPVTVRWWYHLDNATVTPDALVTDFERANPDLKVQAERITWGNGADYANRLYTSLIAGNAPDCGNVQFVNQLRLMEMEALLPLDDRIAAWPGRADIPENLWQLHLAPDGKRYYVPLQFVAAYLYVRQDWFAQKNLPMPTDFDKFLAGAQALTGGDRWGYGMRGAVGGHDPWAIFMNNGGAKFEKGGLTTPAALAANRWFIDLYRVHHVSPPSAPSDGFVQNLANMKAGRTAMAIHHIGSSNDMQAAGSAWTIYGDGSNAIFRQSKNPEAAWRWVSYLSTSAPNVEFNKLAGQVSVTTSGRQGWNFQPKRFLDATFASLPNAHLEPQTPQLAEYAAAVWPQTTQKALLGQISPDDMMQIFEKHLFG